MPSDVHCSTVYSSQDMWRIERESITHLIGESERGNGKNRGETIFKGIVDEMIFELMKVISFHIHKVKHISSQLYTIVL